MFRGDDLRLRVERESVSKAPPDRIHTGCIMCALYPRFCLYQAPALLEFMGSIYPGSPNGHLERNHLGAAHIYLNVEDLGGFTSK